MKKFIALMALLAVTPGAFAGGDADHGKALVNSKGCVACHGNAFNNPTSPDYPKLAGQHEDYLVHALLAYKNSDNALAGRSNPIMQGMAAQLTRQDIDDVAAYLSGLPESVHTRH